jgi:RNA polymerase sigma-70 factor, ECF subfamily
MLTESRKQEDFSLDALRGGDRAEFSRLVDTYSSAIYRLGMKMLEDPQDAEDILQETFIKAFRHLKDFDGRSSLSTWLYRIATNEALMLIRKRKNQPLSLNEPAENQEQMDEPVQIVDWCCMPEDELMSGEAKAYMNQAVEQLPPTLRAVFVLRDIEGLSTEETSNVLKLSEAAVKTRLSRARMRLRELLTEYFGERMSHLRQADGEAIDGA